MTASIVAGSTALASQRAPSRVCFIHSKPDSAQPVISELDGGSSIPGSTAPPPLVSMAETRFSARYAAPALTPRAVILPSAR